VSIFEGDVNRRMLSSATQQAKAEKVAPEVKPEKAAEMIPEKAVEVKAEDVKAAPAPALTFAQKAALAAFKPQPVGPAKTPPAAAARHLSSIGQPHYRHKKQQQVVR